MPTTVSLATEELQGMMDIVFKEFNAAERRLNAGLATYIESIPQTPIDNVISRQAVEQIVIDS